MKKLILILAIVCASVSAQTKQPGVISMSQVSGLNTALNGKQPLNATYWNVGTAANLYSFFQINWSSTTSPSGTKDVGITRSTAGTLVIHDGQNSMVERDLKLRNIIISGTATGITKSMVGLGNVDNTSDATKQAGYDTRYNLVSNNVNPYDYVYRKGQVDTLLNAKLNLTGGDLTGDVITSGALISWGTNTTSAYVSSYSDYRAASPNLQMLVSANTKAMRMSTSNTGTDNLNAVDFSVGNATQKALVFRAEDGGNPLTRAVITANQTQITTTFSDENLIAPLGIFDVTASTNHLFTVYDTGKVSAIKYSVSALNTAPSSATDTGTVGEIRITADYIFVCIATNTWRRTPQLTTW